MRHLGKTGKKILLLLHAGASLSLTRNPRVYFRIVRATAKEWKKINESYMRKAIKRLYRSKLVDYKENQDGTVELVLTGEGRQKILKYDLDKIEIKKPLIWDGLWRLVIFDIPEDKKQGRMAFAAKLKEIGFYPMQKSVFIHPYECKNEIDFIMEIFDLSPFIRFLRVKETDIDLHLKQIFKLN